MAKFGADLNGIGGHITVDSGTFTWKPVKFLWIGRGINDIVVPIKFIMGYKIDGTFLCIHIKDEDEMIVFYTWKAKAIVEALKKENPYIRMYE